jgi:hypothetical protein
MNQQKKQLTQKQRNALYWIFKLLGVAISCAFPIWAICEKYPLWTEKHGSSRAVGVGVILILIVLVIVFRRTIFDFLVDRFNLKHAPPLAIWLVMLIISYVLIYIGNFMRDLTTVLWMGFIGCAIGTLFTFIAENRFGKKKETDDE